MIFPPPMMRVLRYWLQDKRKENNAATTTPGRMSGIVTRRMELRREAPRERAWSSKSGL